MKKRTVVIVGGGSAGLMAASMLSPHLKVMVYEKERLVGRKFLVAGDGGFNLTNDVAREDLVQKYEPFDFMKKTLEVADSDCMRRWLAGFGVQTYTGSSGRVFPLQLKPHGVLKALKNSITENNGEIYTNHPLVDLDDSGNPVVYDVVNQNFLRPVADVCIYALGGASWPKTGSDGNWISIFAKAGIKTIPFQASNCGVEILWPAALMDQFEGLPIKNAAFTCGNLRYHGEATLTRYGLEGSAIYPLIPMVRRAILDAGVAELFIDFKPMQTHEVLLKKISNPGGTKLYAKSLNLTSLQLQLVKNGLTKPQFQNPDFFVNSLKNFRLQISGLRDIHEAISSVGGFPVAQIDSNWQVKGWSSKYVIGEMVDWDAPTGGFLLQGCFASALKVVRHILS